MKTLRPIQRETIERVRFSLAKGNKRVIAQAPTGFGKTTVAAAIVHMARNRGKRVMFCVPAISLIDQTVQSFYDDGIYEVGVLQGNHHMTDYSKPVQVASVQTLSRRKNIPDVDLVIIDEAHRWFKFYGEWMDRWDAIPFVGLSATPWTKGLGKYYQDLIIAATTREMIDAGYLSDFEVYAPSSPDLSKCRTVAGDYHEGDLSEVMDQAPLIADIVQSWKQHASGLSTLCFAVDCAHAKHLQARFESAGVSCGYVDAYTTREDREQIKRNFHSGEYQVVCNVGCLTTGVDWDVRCIVLARPTKSEMLFVQIIGRGLRTADGKDYCLILDHTNTHEKLGFVTDIHHEKLDDGKLKKSSGSEKKERLPSKCPSCTTIKPVGVHACPKCGFAPEKQTDIVEEAGELKRVRAKQKMPDKQAFYSGLIAHTQNYGMNPGWAAHTYREYYGVWPNQLKKVPGPISTECARFIQHKLIKYSKRKGAA